MVMSDSVVIPDHITRGGNTLLGLSFLQLPLDLDQELFLQDIRGQEGDVIPSVCITITRNTHLVYPLKEIHHLSSSEYHVDPLDLINY